jgi:hypothetical protein
METRLAAACVRVSRLSRARMNTGQWQDSAADRRCKERFGPAAPSSDPGKPSHSVEHSIRSRGESPPRAYSLCPDDEFRMLFVTGRGTDGQTTRSRRIGRPLSS